MWKLNGFLYKSFQKRKAVTVFLEKIATLTIKLWNNYGTYKIIENK
jgi:hypothetical protein